jgi:hypothetical protein
MDALMERVRALEAQLGETRTNHRDRRYERKSVPSSIQFTGDFDLREARGVDLSENGICFEIESPLVFPMAIQVDGRVERRAASLVWIQSLANGSFRVGFEFDRALDEAP